MDTNGTFVTDPSDLPTVGGWADVTGHLDTHTAPARLVVDESGGAVRCVACGHRCLVRPGRRGICRVRVNDNGVLRAPTGYVAGLQADPVEKKPFFHFRPGHTALTFGMLGCDFHCAYCQNWRTSQVLRDADAAFRPRAITPAALVQQALLQGACMVVSSYNEPLITSEWAREVFRCSHAAGLSTAVVSNGNATAEAVDFLGPETDAWKIDLKSMSERGYRRLGGVLQHVLDAIHLVYERGFWLEVVTLVVPGFNDDPGELRAAANFIASVSPDIPWHVTAFHADYRMTDTPDTSARQLMAVCEAGRKAGLRFVYAGNRPGRVGPWEDTHCPACHEVVISRTGYRVRCRSLTTAGRCGNCATPVPGRWS